MCLVALAWRASERYTLVLAANRDERHERPRSRPAGGRIGRECSAGAIWSQMAVGSPSTAPDGSRR